MAGFNLATLFMPNPDLVLTLAGIFLQLLLLRLLLRKKIYKTFPFFTTYVSTVVLLEAVRMAVMASNVIYFEVYWGTEGVYAILVLLALHEVFREIFLGFYRAVAWFKLIFPTGVACILTFAIHNAVTHRTPEFPELSAIILSIGSVIRFIQAGLFALFFLLVWLLGVDWENYPFGIMMGFAASALGTWLAYLVRSESGNRFHSFTKYAPPMAYILAVLIWLGTFGRPQPEVQHTWTASLTPEQMLQEFKIHLKILRGKGNGPE